MIFAELPTMECAGAILAHTRRCGGQVFKKSRRLSSEDVARIAAAGIDRLAVVRLEADDVPEDRAAGELAAAFVSPQLRVEPAFTGRANIFTEADGLFTIDVDCVSAINGVTEDVTLATLAAYTPVKAGQMVATVKIIPFAVARNAVDRALALCTPRAIAVAPFRPRRVALIQTEIQGMKPSLFEKAIGVMNERLGAMGNPPVEESRCAHEEAPLTKAIAAASGRGAETILVLGASAIADRHDVIPAAIEAAGGTIHRFGMPVDPGNLLVLGALDGKTIIGLPGCARSPKVNGFDWVLWRVLADMPVSRGDIAAMGVGGLLAEIPSRPQPRERRAPEPATVDNRNIAAVILAAGSSSRMGRNKLLMEFAGRPILCHAVDQTIAAGIKDTVVVGGHQAAKIRAALGERLSAPALRMIETREHKLGMSASLKAGIRALKPETGAVLVMLGDMPRISAALIKRLVAAYNPVEGRTIVVPTVNGKRGNPVLFDRKFFPEMLELAGDVGARHLIGQHDEEVAEVPVEDAAIFADVDTPEAYDRLLGTAAS
jgi:molybdenum cofactor cytidylyltransferase